MHKKSDAPLGDVDIGLLELKKAHIGLHGYINKDDPQHQERKEPEGG